MLQMVRTLAQFTIALEDMRDIGDGIDAAFTAASGLGGAAEELPEKGRGGPEVTRRKGTPSPPWEQGLGGGTLLGGYMKPLKQPENSLLCDPSLVDEIFDQIPELLEHHEQFLEQIHDCVQNWHEKQKVGDLLVQSVGPDPVPHFGFSPKASLYRACFFRTRPRAGSRKDDLQALGLLSLTAGWCGGRLSLDDVIKDLMAAIHRELAEKQSLSFSMAFPPNKVELSAAKADGTESFIFEFPNPDARLGFEQALEDAKKKLASSKNCLDPEFLKAIPIMKTRSGMQFSCASPSHSSPENAHEVWVCNSDGYVGQVCLLSIRKEPIVEACIAVCSARILCIASVPGLKRPYSIAASWCWSCACPHGRERTEPMVSPSSDPAPTQSEDSGPQQCLHISISGSSLELSEPVDSAHRELVPFDSDDTDDESSPSPSGTLQSQASHSTISSSFGNEEIPSCKEAAAETTSSEEEQEPGFLPLATAFGQSRRGESPTDGRALRRSSRGSFTRGSLEDLLSLDPEAYQSSMWLGTEDGCIHVYQSSDNIRNRKNSMKMQHAASVMCILYLDNQVFVSLANGELIVYQREPGRFWDPQNSKSLSLGSPGSPITKMVAVAGKLWCGCQNRVIVLNTATLEQEHTLQVGQDSGRSVSCMVSAAPGVWLSLQGSALVRLYHPTSYEQLAEADITPPVHKMLAGKHTQSGLGGANYGGWWVTREWAGLNTRWAGLRTEVGAVTRKRAWLTGVGVAKRVLAVWPLCPAGPEQPNDAEQRDPTHPRLALSKAKMLVISGGDGYEDFRLTNSSESVGRDDSTNHLLLWRV
uniref:Rho guanine nucleotide exchange factor 17 n=1 Tax=Pavo cristatus TaxID=9049 RepID=A0A8C9F6V1_PAVCR